MPIAKKILNYLEDNKYKYEIVEHRTVFTAYDKAATQHLKPKEIAKTLVIKADSDYILAVVSADKNLDLVKLKKAVNDQRKKEAKLEEKETGKKSKVKAIKKLSLAKEAWMKKNILGKIGATPPFGELLKLDLFVDRSLLNNKKIQVGSGDYESSLLLNVKQYEKIEEPVKGSFGKAKKR